MITIWAVFFVAHIQLKWKIKNSIVFTTLIILGFFDTLTYSKPPFTLQDELDLVHKISDNNLKCFSIGFEELYLLNNKILPTKFVRYQGYDDQLIKLEMPNGCTDLIDKILAWHPDKFVVNQLNIGQCGNAVLSQMADPNAVMEVKIPIEKTFTGIYDIIGYKEIKVYNSK